MAKANFFSFILSSIVVLSIVHQTQADICDLCDCHKCDSSDVQDAFKCSEKIDEYYICDSNSEKLIESDQTIINLDNIQWPSKNTSISAAFNNLKLTYLSNVLCSSSTEVLSPSLIAINLDNNFIESIANNPFKYCYNLTAISIANNLIERLSSDFLKSTSLLERLNLSNNALSEFDGAILSHSKQITELDLSHNQITTLKLNEILDVSPNMKYINVAHNLLFVINGDSRNKYLQLKHLNLSGNKLTVITSNTFSSFPSLRLLSLSANVLSNIEFDAFEPLTMLKNLDLSSNNLKDLALRLPNSLRNFSISSNQLRYWPMGNIPRSLEVLEVQKNNLVEIFNSGIVGAKKIEFTHLKILNVSHNNIETLPSMLFYPALEVFDASHNLFTRVPQYLGAQTPSLRRLRFRGNLIKEIKFATQISAQNLDFSDSTVLNEIDANEFSSISSKYGCIELRIAHSPSLKNIKNSFLKVQDLCKLDLSYNGLKTINHNWANWSALDHGIDFQGNPIDCSCVDSQWLIDFLVPLLHNRTDFQQYLYELRCASPDKLKGHRLVRYLNHDGAFCNDIFINRASYKLYHLNDEMVDYELVWNKGFGLWLIITLTIFIVVCSFSIVFILWRRRVLYNRRKHNRRYHNGHMF